MIKKDELDFTNKEWLKEQQEAADSSGKELFDYLKEETSESVTYLKSVEVKQKSSLGLGAEDGEEFGGGTPKQSLLDRAKGTKTHEALSEALDNILQNYIISIERAEKEGGGEPSALKVEITIDELGDPINGCICITENSGGIAEEKLYSFITLGASGWDETENAVGTWGSGSKVALACLGRWNQVHTHYPGETQKDFAMGAEEDYDAEAASDSQEVKNYYAPNNAYWRVKDKNPSPFDIPEGTTQIFIRRVTPWTKKFFEKEPEYLEGIEELRKIFEAKIRKINNLGFETSIVLYNNMMDNHDYEEIELTKFEDSSVYSGNFEQYLEELAIGIYHPSSILHLRLKKEGSADLKMKILTGPAKHKKDKKGFLMWGNDRLFTDWFGDMSSITKTGGSAAWGLGDMQGNYSDHSPSSGATSGSWRCYVKFESNDPRVIPWNGPIKWGYHNANQTYSTQIEMVLARIVTTYCAQSRALANHSGFHIQNEMLGEGGKEVEEE